MHWAKVLSIQLSSIFSVWTICEGPTIPQTGSINTCEYDWVLYGSCGGINITYQNRSDGNTVQVKTDELGARMGLPLC